MKQEKTTISFRPLTQDDLKLIYQWFKVPEINKWYARGKEWSIKDVENKYLPRLIGKEFVPSYIVIKESRSIGFIQFYPFTHAAMPEGLSLEKANEMSIHFDTTVGIDLFIGDESLMGRGLGREIIREFIEKSVPKCYTTIYIDPEKTNVRAVKSYKKTGFRESAIQASNAICLMSATRDEIILKE